MENITLHEINLLLDLEKELERKLDFPGNTRLQPLAGDIYNECYLDVRKTRGEKPIFRLANTVVQRFKDRRRNDRLEIVSTGDYLSYAEETSVKLSDQDERSGCQTLLSTSLLYRDELEVLQRKQIRETPRAPLKRYFKRQFEDIHELRDHIARRFDQYELTDVLGNERPYFQFKNICPVCESEKRPCCSVVQTSSGPFTGFFNCFHPYKDEYRRSYGLRTWNIPGLLSLLSSQGSRAPRKKEE